MAHVPRILKGKAIHVQLLTGPLGSRRLRFPDFKTIWSPMHRPPFYVTGWVDHRALVPPEELSQWKIQTDESNPRPSGSLHNASTNCATACPSSNSVCPWSLSSNCLILNGDTTLLNTSVNICQPKRFSIQQYLNLRQCSTGLLVSLPTAWASHFSAITSYNLA